MNDITEISTTGVMIGSLQNTSIAGFNLEHNKKINYLPENTGEKFPNLIGFSAFDSGVKEISKANFANLVLLKELHLSKNVKSKINSNTFEGLLSLKAIFLGKN